MKCQSELIRKSQVDYNKNVVSMNVTSFFKNMFTAKSCFKRELLHKRLVNYNKNVALINVTFFKRHLLTIRIESQPLKPTC